MTDMNNNKILVNLKKKIIEVRHGLRRLTFGKRLKPSFVIVGAQKAGTTSLYRYLIQHPNIKSSLLKEIHYFDLNYNKSLSWYHLFFPLKTKKNNITGEASPYYMFHPFAIERIAKVNPDIKIIVLLREPASRAISHFYHEVRLGREYLNMKEAMGRESQRLEGEQKKFRQNPYYKSHNYQYFSYRSRGLYVDQIKEIKKFFSDDKIMIIDSNDFFNKTEKVVENVLTFLNQEIVFDIQTEKQFNTWDKNQDLNEDSIRKELKLFYKNPNKELFDLIDKKFDWD